MITNSATGIPSEQKQRKIATILCDVSERRARREPIDVPAITQQHPELMPDLGIQLAALQAQDSSGSFSGPPQLEMAPSLPAPILADMDNMVCLDSGAQGYIYKATQRSTKRDVAIKVILNGPAATREQRLRFRKEVELIARLEHPNIVRVYDSGEAAGCSYIVMEYIRGLRIDDYVCVEQLSVRRVVSLFCTVCDAVDFAHKHAVLHRDLKPSNILIDEAGLAHVLDFGLAKDLEGGAEATMVSQEGQVVGTLPYLSPDQVRGEPSSVQTDVYALGVILFELVTGEYPYPITDDRYQSLTSIVAQEPASPRKKLAAGSNGLIRAGDINSDLERVMLKALSKDRVRRYASAADFADDLRRYLAGAAVQARSASRIYLLRKTVRKYRVLFGALAALIVILVGALIGVTSAWRQSERVAKIAMAGMEMASLLKVGGVERDAGRLGEAAGLFQNVIDIGYSLDTDDPQILRPLCLAHQRLVEDRIDKKQPESAVFHVEKASELASELTRRFPSEAIYQNLEAFSFVARGKWLSELPDHKGAIDAYAQAAAILERLLKSQPYSPTLTGDVAFALGLQGSAARKFGNMDLAIDCYTKSYEIMKKLHDEAPNDLNRSLDLVRAESKMAIAYISMKTPGFETQAEAWMSKAESRLAACKRHDRAIQRLFTIDQLAYEITYNKDILRKIVSSQTVTP